MPALEQHIQHLLEQEHSFLSRHMAALLVLQREADARPVLEDAFSRSYEVRRGLESDMIDFQAQINRIARSAGLPTHTRLLQLRQCRRPSERAKERQAEQNRLIAIFFEERTTHVSSDESSYCRSRRRLLHPRSPRRSAESNHRVGAIRR